MAFLWHDSLNRPKNISLIISIWKHQFLYWTRFQDNKWHFAFQNQWLNTFIKTGLPWIKEKIMCKRDDGFSTLNIVDYHLQLFIVLKWRKKYRKKCFGLKLLQASKLITLQIQMKLVRNNSNASKKSTNFRLLFQRC